MTERWFVFLLWLIRKTCGGCDRDKAYRLYDLAMDFDPKDPRVDNIPGVEYVNRLGQTLALRAGETATIVRHGDFYSIVRKV